MPNLASGNLSLQRRSKMPSPDLFVKYRFTPEQKKATQERAISLIKFLNEVTHGGINNHKEVQKQSKLKSIYERNGIHVK